MPVKPFSSFEGLLDNDTTNCIIKEKSGVPGFRRTTSDTCNKFENCKIQPAKLWNKSWFVQIVQNHPKRLLWGDNTAHKFFRCSAELKECKKWKTEVERTMAENSTFFENIKATDPQ